MRPRWRLSRSWSCLQGTRPLKNVWLRVRDGRSALLNGMRRPVAVCPVKGVGN